MALGVGDLEGEALPPGRARRPGGGRRQSACLDPGLVPALLALVEPEERGDPMSPLRWTVKSTRALAAELSAQGHRVSPAPGGPAARAGVQPAGRRQGPGGELARGPGRPVPLYRRAGRRAHGRRAAGGQRRRQEEGNGRRVRQRRPAVAAQGGPGPGPRPRLRLRRRREGDPVRDLRPGRERRLGQRRHRPRHRRVRRGDHPPLVERPRPPRLPRRRPAPGHRRRRRRQRLPHPRLENGPGRACPRNRPRNHRLPLPARHLQVEQDRAPPLLPHHHELARTPPDQPRGRRRRIAATTTRTGLTVHAELDPGSYPTGQAVTDAEMDALPLTRHDWHGNWNYTLRPEPAARAAARGPPPGRTPPSPAWNPRNGTSS